MISPGASSLPASNEPIIATSAPPASALARSPRVDAAIGDHRHIGLRRRRRRVHHRGQLRHADAGDDARRADRSARCRFSPHPRPHRSALWLIGGGDMPATIWVLLIRASPGSPRPAPRLNGLRGIDHDDICASLDQRHRTLAARIADRGGGPTSSRPRSSLARLGEVCAFSKSFTVMGRPRAHRRPTTITRSMRCLCSRRFGVRLVHALAHRDGDCLSSSDPPRARSCRRSACRDW